MSLTPGQRLQGRLAQADPARRDPAWGALSEWYSHRAVARSGKRALVVRAAPHAALGHPGCFIPAEQRICLDGGILPGSPDTLDPFRAEDFAALSALHGVFLHELGHAVHSSAPLTDDDPVTAHMLRLLEEPRMEGRVLATTPADAPWLRASARQLILAETDFAEAISAGGVGGAISAAALIEGRVLAGSLTAADATQVSAVIDALIDPDVAREVRAVLRAALAVGDGDAESLRALAARLAALVPDEERGGGGGAGGAALVAAVEAAAEQASQAASGDLQSDSAGEILDALAEALADERKLREAMIASPDPTTPGSGTGPAGGNPMVSAERAATGAERVMRRQLARILRRARVRTRDRRQVRRNAPPGRLVGREALRESAERAQGRMVTAKPWQASLRRTVPEPRLRVGVLIDTSGSMHASAPMVSSALWAILGAVSETGGTTCAYGFGDTVESLYAPGETPRSLREFTALGGTEHTSDAIIRCTRDLNLDDQTRPSLLIILSDGHWTGHESRRAAEQIERLRNVGVGVIQVGIGTLPVVHGASQAVMVPDAPAMATVIGEACRRALALA